MQRVSPVAIQIQVLQTCLNSHTIKSFEFDKQPRMGLNVNSPKCNLGYRQTTISTTTKWLNVNALNYNTSSVISFSRY